jgi:hypothetical protein
MKINWFLFAIAFVITGLCAYGFFTAHIASEYRLVITIGSFISLFVPLAGLFAVKLDFRGAINVRIISALAFIALMIDHIIFTVKIKSWQLEILRAAFGGEIDTSKTEAMFSLVPPDIFKNADVFSFTPYIIVTGILLMVYLLAAYGVGKAMKDAV